MSPTIHELILTQTDTHAKNHYGGHLSDQQRLNQSLLDTSMSKNVVTTLTLWQEGYASEW